MVPAVDFVLRETALFAAVGFLLLGLSDFLLDLIWAGHRCGRAAILWGQEPQTASGLGAPASPGPIAVFVPAWDEAAVIGSMLRHALAAFAGADVQFYVGCYPNDPLTIAAVRSLADPRLHLVLGPVPGPTTKADCLNRIWERMLADERGAGRRFKAVVLHDAEDVVHSAEIAIFDRLIEEHDLVQLPVLPLIDRRSRWIGGHYADEFAEAHGKGLVVREAIGAALPSAGVGCAISRAALDRLAERHGLPFDAESVTEDYELGLRLRQAGGRAVFVRIAAAPGRPIVATREFFPTTLAAAVGQKSRWMQGIALSGWDRLGWNGGLAERWMRMRDRQSLLAALLVAAGYAAFILWTVRTAGTFAAGLPPVTIPEPLRLLLIANGGLLLWRLGMRFAFATQAYGWREGLRALPRTVVGNLIAMLAARQAVMRYAAGRGASAWDKTDHAFPAQVPAE